MQQVATGYGLIEGPVWDPARGLYFSDVINGGVPDTHGWLTYVYPDEAPLRNTRGAMAARG